MNIADVRVNVGINTELILQQLEILREAIERCRDLEIELDDEEEGEDEC